MSILGWSAFLFAMLMSAAAAAQEKPLPTVVLVGDSIRMGYAPLVARRLEGKAIVVSAKANGEDTRNVLKNLDEWVITQSPAVVHLNAGLHDLKRTPKGHQVPIADYERNLKTILERIRNETRAAIIFATTTPILDALHAERKAGFDRLEADVERYNAVAVSVMNQLRIPVNDLHRVVESAGTRAVMAGDGTHYTQEGYETLAAVVAESIVRALAEGGASR